MIRVTVWNEYYHETVSEEIRAVYPQGIHQTIADFLGKNEDMTVRTAVRTSRKTVLPMKSWIIPTYFFGGVMSATIRSAMRRQRE